MKLKIVCIGAGYFARFHVEAWQRMPDAEVVAICDHDIQKAQLLAEEFEVDSVFSTIETVVQDVDFDAVDIITPPDTHLHLVHFFAKAKKHIICQKPLAPTLAEAEELVAITEKANLRFMVHENFRFQPWYRQIKQMLNKGMLGDQLHNIHMRMRMGDGWGDDAYLSRQPYFQTMPRLLVYETGIHFIDVFRYLGGEVSNVYARLRKLNPVIAGEDSGLLLFDFIQGGQALLDANRYNEPNADNPRYTFGEMTLEGSGGTIRLYMDGRISWQPLGEPERDIPYLHEDRGFAGDCVFFTQQHFVQALKTGVPFETNGRDYLKNLQLQEAVYLSARERRDVPLVD